MNTTPPLVGLIGRAGAGKDTFAARLVSDHGYTRLAFADALKDVLADTNPIISHDLIADEPIYLADVLDALGWDKAKQLPTVRNLLQRLGVAVRDHVHDEAWIGALANKAWHLRTPVVVTDVRFPNEADWIIREGGILVRITRPDLPTMTHISETALDNYPVTLTFANDGSIHALHRVADHLASAVSPLSV